MAPLIDKERGWISSKVLPRPLVTGQPKLSWLSVGILNCVWFGEVYTALLNSVGLAFVARRLTADTRMIALVSTIGLLFRGSIGPVINYVSDRIWTPLGRRRPFVISAYFLSAVGLVVIPYMGSITTLIIAVVCHACLLSFASPMEPLYMELVPPPQQGRSQAMRNALIQVSVLYFFQVSLAQFDLKEPILNGWLMPSGGATGVHLAFWLGAGLLALMAAYLATCTREKPSAQGPVNFASSPPLMGMLKTFPRDVFGDRRWWPAYGLYVAPGLIGGVWGSLQPLMLVEQFGYDMTGMARIGLPVSLAGLAVIAPLLGYCADRGARYHRWQLLIAALLLLGLSCLGFRAMPQQTRELPSLEISLAFCLPLGVACVCMIVGAVAVLGKSFEYLGPQSRYIIVSLSGQAVVAFIAWTWVQCQRDPQQGVPVSAWLAYMTLTQAFGLASSVALMPLLFSKIPSSKFGTVSSGFGIFGAVSMYALGNVGGTWVHFWTKWRSSQTTQYTGLWLLQALVAVVALIIALRCMRTPLMVNDPKVQGSQ